MRYLGKSDLWRELLEVYESPDKLYIVFSYFQGQTLTKLISSRKGKPFTETTARKILFSLILALHQMHMKGVVFRNISPDNIIIKDMCFSTGSKIIDFKLACFMDQEPIFAGAGTPGFMAPELLSKKTREVIAPSIDVFSVGVLFYTLLDGQYLFHGSNSKKLLMQNKVCLIDFGKISFNKLSFGCLQLMQNMLTKKPEARIKFKDIFEHKIFSGEKVSLAKLSIPDMADVFPESEFMDKFGSFQSDGRGSFIPAFQKMS